MEEMHNIENMEKIAQGAEASLYSDKERILKQRFAKSYRHPALDIMLRKTRTRKEAKVISKIQEFKFPAPKLLNMCDKNMKIEMDFVKGTLMKTVLDKGDQNPLLLSKDIGKNIAQLHMNNIVHGDLTTSNMILGENKKVNFIDFGLSFTSDKEEDKAVDLHLLRKALESKHHTIADQCLAEIHRVYQDSYPGAEAVMERLKKVENRGRHKNKNI